MIRTAAFVRDCARFLVLDDSAKAAKLIIYGLKVMFLDWYVKVTSLMQDVRLDVLFEGGLGQSAALRATLLAVLVRLVQLARV